MDVVKDNMAKNITLGHILRLQTTYPTQAQEWFCPDCAYRSFVKIGPGEGHRKIVLNYGNVAISHLERSVRTAEVMESLTDQKQERKIAARLGVQA